MAYAMTAFVLNDIMDKIRVIAIDDEPLALRQLSTYIGKIPYFQLVAECVSANDALQVLNSEIVDAIFTDINMPDLSGMDLVKQLAAKPIIVFTTAYSDYAVEGYKVDAVDYLLKPFGLQEFQRAAEKVRRQWTLNQQSQGQDSAATTAAANLTAGPDDDTIFVKSDYRTVSVKLSDIRYIEGMSEYLKLHLSSQPKPIITLLSMKRLEDVLPKYFMRIHRSYIVNLKAIVEVNKNRVILDKDTSLPISDNYRDAFTAYLDSRYLTK